MPGSNLTVPVSTVSFPSARVDAALLPEPLPVPASKFRRDVQGMRALAVGVVLAYHAGLSWLPGGYVGVDVFFVISGFLITGLLCSERAASGRTSLGSFWARRARRVLPASTLVLLCTLLASHLLLAPARLTSLNRDAWVSALFAANWRFASLGTNYLTSAAPPSPLQHLWSLAVEEQFYLVWPLVFILLAGFARSPFARSARARLALGLTTLTALSLTWSFLSTASGSPSAYFSPFTRAWELGLGGLVALLLPLLTRTPRARPLQIVRVCAASLLAWAGLAMILIACVFFTVHTPFPGLAALLPVGGAALLIAGGSVPSRWGPAGLLSLAPFQYLGAISYSLYLWHWPILTLAHARLGAVLPLSTTLLLVAASLVCAQASYLLVEQPARRAPSLAASPGAGLTFGVSLTACAVAVATALLVNTAAPAVAAPPPALASRSEVLQAVRTAALTTIIPEHPFPTLLTAASDEGPAYRDHCLLAPSEVIPDRPCVYGDARATRTLVLVGDSHAGQWLPAFDDLGVRLHWRVILMGKLGCPSADVLVWSKELGRQYDECTRWRAQALERIIALHPQLVVHTANGHTFLARGTHRIDTGLPAAWQAGLSRTLTRLAPAVGRQIVLGDIPNLTLEPADCLPFHPTTLDACGVTPSEGVYTLQQAAERAAAASAHAHYVDVLPFLCTQSRCPAVIAGYVVYRDRFHLTVTFGRWLEGILAADLALTPPPAPPAVPHR